MANQMFQGMAYCEIFTIGNADYLVMVAYQSRYQLLKIFGLIFLSV